MNLTIQKRDALRLASRMAGVAEKKGGMPMLANVLLSAGPNGLGFAATDLYLGLTGASVAEIARSGSLAVSAKDFVDRIKTLPEGPISLTEQGGSLQIRAPGSARRFSLRSVNGDDFPPVAQPADGAARVTIDAGTLSWLINHTIFSVSTDESRPHMNGALLEWEGDVLRMVGTDGHRMAKAERKVEGKSATTWLIPLRALHEVRRIADDIYAAAEEGADRSITIVSSSANAFFIGGGLTFGVKLLDATFPPYQQVIPANFTTRAVVKRASLLDSVRALSVAADSKGGLRMSFTKGKLDLSAASPDAGDGSDELVVTYDGAKLVTGFNAKYLVEALSVLTTEDVVLDVNGELDPMVVRPGPGAAEGTDTLCVVMPMRI